MVDLVSKDYFDRDNEPLLLSFQWFVSFIFWLVAHTAVFVIHVKLARGRAAAVAERTESRIAWLTVLL